MKIWIDDVRPAPNSSDWEWCKSVDEAINFIVYQESCHKYNPFGDEAVELIDIDHDAGDYAVFGGDYIKLLDWLEETGRNYPIHIHSMNPVGIQNMRAIIQKNGWKEL